MAAEMIGQWFMVEGIMDWMMVQQVLEFQKHGDRRKFGQIAVSRQLISGKELRKYENHLRA